MKYCGKCGSPLDPELGLCPRCDKNETTSKNKKIKKKFIIIPIAVLLVCAIAASTLLFSGVFSFFDDKSHNTISEADANKMIQLTQKISEMEKNGDGQEEIENYLSNIEWMEHVNKTDDGGLSCRTKFGVTGVWTPKSDDAIGAVDITRKSAEIKNTVANSSNSFTVNKIALLCPYVSTDSNFKIDDYGFLGDSMKKYAGSAFTVFKDGEVTLDLLKDLDKYDMVWFYSHGALSNVYNSAGAIFSSDPYTTTGEFADNAAVYKLLSDDFFTGRTIVCLNDSRIAVGGDFYQHYYKKGQLDNTFFHFASCNSMRTEKIADGLLSRGASWVEGWSDSVNFSNDYGQFMWVLENLLNGKSISQSVTNADSTMKGNFPKVYQEQCKLKGKGNNEYSLNVYSNTRINLFEEYSKALSGSVSGTVVSSNDNSPLNDVSITVFQKNSSEKKEVATSFTDESGSFTISLSKGEYDLVFSKNGFTPNTTSIRIESTVMTILKDNIVLEMKNNGFVNDKYLVEYNDVIYGIDRYGLWKNEGGSKKEYLKKCLATNLATNGQVIYYSVWNSTTNHYSSSSPSSPSTSYTYDMYEYDLNTGTSKKVMSFNECGRPICAVGDTVYYTDYPDDTKNNPQAQAARAQGLCSYNSTTGEKRYITDGAHIVQSYNDKIFYRDLMAAVPNGSTHQIYCYDTATGKTEMISDGGVMGFKVLSGKVYYNILNQESGNSTVKVCVYDISSGDTEVLMEKTGDSIEVQDYDESIAIYSTGSMNDIVFYRVDLTSGREEKIQTSNLDGYLPHKAMRSENRTVFYTDYSGGNVYTMDDNSTKINSSVGSYKWEKLLAFKDEIAFAVSCDSDDFTGEHKGETMFVDPSGSGKNSNYYEYYICCERIS